MGISAVRYLDNAVGIVVLLLLATAVVGGQVASSPRSSTTSGMSMEASYPLTGQAAPFFLAAGADDIYLDRYVDLDLPVIELVRELRRRESGDDRPALLDD